MSALFPSVSAILLSILLSACQDHKPAIDTFGQLDSAMVAADTTMQVNMDRSYEYLRTFAEGDSVAYDFLAYDKPKNSSGLEWESKYLIIRRARGVQDTIAKEPRHGKVSSVWLSDLNHNGRSELFFYTCPDQEMKKVQDYTCYAFETNGRSKADRLPIDMPQERHLNGQDDSFFTYHDRLVRAVTTRAEGDAAPKEQWQTYKLVNGRLIFEGQKTVMP